MAGRRGDLLSFSVTSAIKVPPALALKAEVSGWWQCKALPPRSRPAAPANYRAAALLKPCLRQKPSIKGSRRESDRKALKNTIQGLGAAGAAWIFGALLPAPGRAHRSTSPAAPELLLQLRSVLLPTLPISWIQCCFSTSRCPAAPLSIWMLGVSLSFGAPHGMQTTRLLAVAEKRQPQGHAEHSVTSPQGMGRAEADPIPHPKPKPFARGPPGAGCSPRSLPCPTRRGDSGGSGSGGAQPAPGTAAARSSASLKCRQRGLHDKAGGGRPC